MLIYDMKGQTFGRWTVVERVANNKRQTMWRCICKCGTERDVNAYSLRSGGTLSCGCLTVEVIKKTKTKHGHNQKNKPTREYKIWTGMHTRCYNKKEKAYLNYGARGIKVCDRWRDYRNFISDMGMAPSNKHSIERNDVNGNYEPSNCKWATTTEQARNKRVSKNNTSGVSGVEWNENGQRWRARITVNKKKFSLGSFENIEDAIRARKKAEIDLWS